MAEETEQHIPEPERVPETPPSNPEPEHTPEPRHDDDLRAVVDKLSEAVAGLSTRVEQLTTQPADETPGGKPWTHRGSFK